LYDVAIIGAGPAGSHLAATLSAARHEVLVIDQNDAIGDPVCCTGIIGTDCVTSYSIEDELVYRWASSAKLFSPNGRMVPIARPEPQAAMVDRARLNESLAMRAEHHGAEYALNTELLGVRVHQNGVTIDVENHQATSSFRARAIVLATGFVPARLDALRLGRVADATLGAHAEVIAPDVDEVEVYTGRRFAPGSFAWLAPSTPGRALVGLMTRRTPDACMDRFLSFLITNGKVQRVCGEPSYRAIPLSPLPRTYGERLLVVGSAAGQVKPITGGGVYYGLLCADIAAEHLQQALDADDLSQRTLSAYEREWKRRIGSELRTGSWARKVYEHLNDKQIERLFHVTVSSGLLEELQTAEDLSFDWHDGFVTRAIGSSAILKALAAVSLPSILADRLVGSTRAENTAGNASSAASA
jgi:geranylgeranyl reductase family protein